MSIAVAAPPPIAAISTLALRAAAPAVAAHAHRASHLSGGAVALIALGAVLVLGCLAWALARAFAFEPRWTLSLRHALAEARLRIAATWAEFGDWLRLGH
ncbi:MAG TPA: hypothetical protein VL979_07525 [Solirubrobacteraceae bacterium]|nr:hypothetical protein [Solirubrobacteraceae bacterium]